jgi:hypothetical protein
MSYSTLQIDDPLLNLEIYIPINKSINQSSMDCLIGFCNPRIREIFNEVQFENTNQIWEYVCMVGEG